jgi:DHA1 family bicyclomycin/chloramphenicol resistance-like MFS transporter
MTSSSRPPRYPGWLLLVASMSAVGPFTIDMYLPGFPEIARDLEVDGVEQTMAAYLIGITFGQLIYGPISDRFGRKPPLYFGFVLYALGSVGCAAATSLGMLMLMRVLQALGACAGFVIGRAIVRDRCEPHEAARAFATLMAVVAIGPIIAPMLGGWVVTAVGWRGVFVFQALLAIVLLIMMHTLLTETLPPEAARPLHPLHIARRYAHLLADPVLVGYSMVSGFGMGTLFCYVTGAPIVMASSYGLSPQQFGWMLGLNGLAFMTASRINMLELRNRTPKQVLSASVRWPLAVSALFLILAFTLHLPLWAVIALQLLFFVSTARTMPHTSALALAPHGKEAGAASALMGSLQSLLSTLAGVAVAVFNDGTLPTLTILLVGGALLALSSFVWVSWKESKMGN